MTNRPPTDEAVTFGTFIVHDDATLSTESLKYLRDKNYKCLTPVQTITIPTLVKGKDVLVESQTGSGKTLAFILPICELLVRFYSNLHKTPLNVIDGVESLIVAAMILAPTRELVTQISAIATELFSYYENSQRDLMLSCLSLNRNIPVDIDFKNTQRLIDTARTRQKVNLATIVSTPGRICAHISYAKKHADRQISNYWNFANLQVLIVDEVDRILNHTNQFVQLETILRLLPKYKTVGFFSATINSSVKTFADKIMRNARFINLSRKSTFVDKLTQYFIQFNNLQNSNVVETAGFVNLSSYKTSSQYTNNAEDKCEQNNSQFSSDDDHNNIDEYMLDAHESFSDSDDQANSEINIDSQGCLTDKHIETVNDAIMKCKSNENTGFEIIHTIPSNIKNFYLICPYVNRALILYKLLKLHKDNRVIIFCATCRGTDFLHSILTRYFDLNITMYKFHGKLKEHQRKQTLDEFQSSGAAVLIASDLAARGIDFVNVNFIIQFDSPANEADYYHRIGRAGRMQKNIAYSLLLVTDAESSLIDYLTTKHVTFSEDTNPIRLNDAVNVNITYSTFDFTNVDQNCYKLIMNQNLQSNEFISSVDHTHITLNETVQYIKNVRLRYLSDGMLFKNAITAFVSHFRSYESRELSYLCSSYELNVCDLVLLYCLFKVPRLKRFAKKQLTFFPFLEIGLHQLICTDVEQNKKFKVYLQKLQDSRKAEIKDRLNTKKVRIEKQKQKRKCKLSKHERRKRAYEELYELQKEYKELKKA